MAPHAPLVHQTTLTAQLHFRFLLEFSRPLVLNLWLKPGKLVLGRHEILQPLFGARSLQVAGGAAIGEVGSFDADTKREPRTLAISIYKHQLPVSHRQVVGKRAKQKQADYKQAQHAPTWTYLHLGPSAEISCSGETSEDYPRSLSKPEVFVAQT